MSISSDFLFNVMCYINFTFYLLTYLILFTYLRALLVSHPMLVRFNQPLSGIATVVKVNR